MTRNEYIAHVLTGCRGELEHVMTDLGLGPNDANMVTMALVSKTLENVADHVRGRRIRFDTPKGERSELLNPKGPSPLGVKVPVKA